MLDVASEPPLLKLAAECAVSVFQIPRGRVRAGRSYSAESDRWRPGWTSACEGVSEMSGGAALGAYGRLLVLAGGDHAHRVGVAVRGLGDGAARSGREAAEIARLRTGDVGPDVEGVGVERAATGHQDGDATVLAGGRSSDRLGHFQGAGRAQIHVHEVHGYDLARRDGHLLTVARRRSR